MLNINDISLTFYPGTANEKKVLQHLSLDVHDGDFISIIGANGAGKTTLFNAIGGTYLTDSGSILLDGQDITMEPDHSRAKKIGRLFQDTRIGTAPDMTLEDNLALAAGHGGWLSIKNKKDRDFFREKVAAMGLGMENKMQTPVGFFSGGQRQAVALLMATINPPKLLLLDEHTAALDPAASERIMELTDKIVRENRLTCLMITHNMQMALDLGNRTVMMDAGRIIYDVSGEERSKLTVPDLLELFRERSGKAMVTDRILLSES